MDGLRIRAVGLCFLLVAVAACACTHEPASAPGSRDVQVRVSTVGFDASSGSHYVLLEDRKKDLALPILIGENQARTIALEIHGLKPPRPFTQDLMQEILRTTGNKVDHVLIYAAHNRIYYARVSLDSGRYRVDARPSDAIALALGMHAPIFVNAKLLRPRAGLAIGPRSRLPRTARGLGITVQALTPGIAKYMNVAPDSGLLVASVDSDAQAAGVRRGDIVVAVAGRGVKALSDFEHETADLRAGRSVTLTIKRNGVSHSVTIDRSSGD